MSRSALLTGFALAALAAPAAAEAPSVVASIKPVHSLVAGVMAGVGTPALLVSGAASPHSYGLKPSAARGLQDAAVVFWIGPGLETFLEKPLGAIATSARTVPLAEAEGVDLLPAREGGVWQAHEHDHHEDHDHVELANDAPERREGRADFHIWLDPSNAIQMVRAIEAALIETDPGHAATYASNAEALIQQLQALDQDLRQRLGPVEDAPFVVFHDAYQYFERHYHLNGAGAITISPDRQPGAQRIQEIRHQLADAGAVCVFSEPQFEPALVSSLIEGTAARTGVLDPIGAALLPGPGLYPALLDDLAGALIGCLDADPS